MRPLDLRKDATVAKMFQFGFIFYPILVYELFRIIFYNEIVNQKTQGNRNSKQAIRQW